MDSINMQILNGFDFDCNNKLTTRSMLPKLMNSKSMEVKKKKFENALLKNGNTNTSGAWNDYAKEVISPGSKGCLRGLEFNNYISSMLLKLVKDYNFKVEFEKKVPSFDEKVDWIIKNENTGKWLVGMNQVALWGGGHQYNRAGKYILNHNPNLLCVVNDYVQVKTEKSKLFEIFRVGFENQSLCYPQNMLQLIITKLD